MTATSPRPPPGRAPTAPPDPPRAGQRVRQGRPARAGHRAARGRRRDRVHRVDRGADRRRGRAGDARRGGHRVPGVPRRAGQDAAPAGARRAARGHPQARRTPRRSSRWASRRSTCWWSTSTRSPRPSPPVRRPTSASSRSTSAGRRWSARPRRTTQSVAVVVDPTRYAWVLEQAAEGGVHAGRPPGARGRGVPRTPRPTTSPWPPGWATCSRPTGTVRRSRAGWAPPLGRARRAAVRGEPAPGRRALRRPGAHLGHRRRDAAARQGDVVQQLRRHRRRLACRARPRREPAWRSSSTRTRAASRSAPTSPRRTARPTPATRSARSAGSSPPTARSRRPWPSRSPRSSPR